MHPTIFDSSAGSTSAPHLSQTPIRPPRQRAFWFPLILLFAFLGVFAYVLRDRILPGPEIRVVRAIAVKASLTAHKPTGDHILFQAAGWIEPDPLPIHATALINGVVETVHVLEGESVTNRQLLATLVSDEQRLALRQAEVARDILEAERATHMTQKQSLNANLKALEAKQLVAKAELAEREDTEQRLAKLDDDIVPEKELAQARLKRMTQEAEVVAIMAEAPAIEAELSRHDALMSQLNHKVALSEISIETAQLALDRTQVRAPADGIILKLFATPGRKQMLNSDSPQSTTVAALYQPDHLQVRVDVALADAGALEVGMPAKISLDLLPDQIFSGAVTRVVGEADLQRNTLQAKVSVRNPDLRLRPEMLARVEFLPPPRAEKQSSEAADLTNQKDDQTAEARLSVFVPPHVLHQKQGDRAEAWVYLPESSSVAKREVLLSDTTREGWLGVREGLRPGDLLVDGNVSELLPNRRVRLASTSATPDSSNSEGN